MSRTGTTTDPRIAKGYIVITPKGIAHRIFNERSYCNDEDMNGSVITSWVGRGVELRTICGLKVRTTWENFGRVDEGDIDTWVGLPGAYKVWHDCESD